MLKLLIPTVAALCLATGALSQSPALQESAFLTTKVDDGTLPPVAERAPIDPLFVDLRAKGRAPGKQGGTLNTMITRKKDIRQMVVYGYARLVGYDHKYELKPDILRAVDNEGNRRFVLHLREGHRWSDGHPLTSEDFRYWWEDVANHPELSPSGPPDFMRVAGQTPQVSFPDALTIEIEWDAPNPNFLPTLAQARPPFIYRPAHFLKQFHAGYAESESLRAGIEEARASSWAALHNKLDNMYKFDNPDLPTLQPWMKADGSKKIRHTFVRNPFYHRFDSDGVQLPYIDTVEMEIVSGGLVAAKSNAGEVDLQARGLAFRDVSILKKGELDGADYQTRLWSSGVASQIAIYPNLNYGDPVWREVLRNVRVRRALSLAVDRDIINRVLYFDLAQPGAMAVLPESPLYNEKNRDAWANYDPDLANQMLDQAGLQKRDSRGIRLLPDGRPMELVVETAGERQEVEDTLQIITDTWREIGVKLVMRPLDRDILRNRVFAGTTMASVWYGWDNGLPTAETSPDRIAPRHQEFLAWPMWGQYFQTGGTAGQRPDMEPARRLMNLSTDWDAAKSREQKQAIWKEMLEIHADNVFAIGVLALAPQPVVVANSLRNVPEDGLWAWEPGAHFGVHRMDEFFFAPGAGG